MHELPLHPLTITNLLMWPVENLLLPVAEWALPVAQSLPSIDEVPDAFVKNWMIMMGFAVMIIIQIWTAMRGGQVQKRDVSGTLTTVPEKQHADQSEVDDLEDDVQSLRDEMLGMHNQSATAATARVQALSTVIEVTTRELERKMETKVDAVMRKVEAGFDAISKKLDPVVVDVAKHETHLEDVVPRLLRVETRLSDASQRLHERINDLIQKPKR